MHTLDWLVLEGLEVDDPGQIDAVIFAEVDAYEVIETELMWQDHEEKEDGAKDNRDPAQ